MNQEEVLNRLRDELDIPFFNGKIEDKNYSEEEYQEVKKKLTDYFDNYVRNVEN
ncbi:MAG: hypothetical protein ACK5NA_07965 [Enterococcus sp.]